MSVDTFPETVSSPSRVKPKKAARFAKILEAVGFACLTLLVFLGGWTLISRYMGPALFPGPSLVFAALRRTVANGILLESILASLRRIGIGYSIGLCTGVVSGIILAQIRFLDRLLMPIISLARMLSPTAIIPLAIIWFGIGEPSKYFVVAWACVLVMFLATYDAISRVPKTRIWAAQCMGANRFRIIREVILPSSIPPVWTAARTCLGLSFMSVIAAELIAAPSGLGFMIMQSRVLVQTDRMFVGLLALSVTGLAVDFIYSRIGKLVLRRYIDFYGQN